MTNKYSVNQFGTTVTVRDHSEMKSGKLVKQINCKTVEIAEKMYQDLRKWYIGQTSEVNKEYLERNKK